MDNVVEIGARRANSAKSDALLEVESRVVPLLAASFKAALCSCDDVLFGHAQRSMNGTRQAQFFDDARMLRLGQEAAVQRFTRACQNVFRGLPVAVAQETTARSEHDLKLIADEDLELDLALFRIGKRCDEIAPRLRHQVQRRFQVLLGLGEGTTTPLCGSSLSRMVRAGIVPLDLGLESRLIVLKQLERQLAEVSERALELANAVLIESGVLPHLRATPAAPRPASSGAVAHSQPIAHAAATHASQAPAIAAAPTVSAAELGDFIAQISQWLGQNTPMAVAELPADSEPVVAPPAAVPTVATPPASAESESSELEAARERRRQEIAARREAEVQRARELRIAAERSAENVVGIVLQQTHVPEAIANIVRGPLRRHLEMVHTRRGETSTEWRSACKLVRDIAWALDPETVTTEQDHWRAMVPDIVDALRAALLAVGTDEREVDRVVAGFGMRYEAMLSPQRAPEPTPKPEVVVAANSSAATVDSPATGFSEALRRVRQLVLGQWFELVDDQGQLQRAKLVWTSAMTERCLFVNGQGKLVADRPHARVAHDLVAGAFRAVDDANCAVMA